MVVFGRIRVMTLYINKYDVDTMLPEYFFITDVLKAIPQTVHELTIIPCENNFTRIFILQID